MSQIRVGVEVPNVILGVETSLLKLLGHSPKYLYGQSLDIFCGPDTDLNLIVRSLNEAGLKEGFIEIDVVLYELNGRPRKVGISFSPCTRTLGHPVCSILTLSFSESILVHGGCPATTANIYSQLSFPRSTVTQAWFSVHLFNNRFPGNECCTRRIPACSENYEAVSQQASSLLLPHNQGICSNGIVLLPSSPARKKPVPIKSRATIDLDYADGAGGGAADGWGGHGGGGSWSGFEDRGGWPDWANIAAPPAYPAADPLAL